MEPYVGQVIELLVTQEDIDEGLKSWHEEHSLVTTCAIARAASRVFGKEVFVDVYAVRDADEYTDFYGNAGILATLNADCRLFQAYFLAERAAPSVLELTLTKEGERLQHART